MTRDESAPANPSGLRKAAEERLRETEARATSAGASEPELRRLLHELQVQRIELEMQNEELRQLLGRSPGELEESGGAWEDLFEFAPVGYCTLGVDGTILKLNLAGASLLGRPRGDLLKRRLALYLEGGSRPTFSAFLAEVLAGRSTRPCDVAVLREGADSTILRLAGTAAEGSTARITMTDITEHTRAEEALRRSEQQFRSVLENMQDAYFRADSEGRYVLVSPSAPRIFGYDSVEELMAVPAADLYADPEERKAVLQDIRTSGGLEDWIGRARRKDGSLFWVSMSAHFVRDDEGHVVGTESVVRDITERKAVEEALRESEERFRRLFERHSACMLLVEPASGRILDANPAAAGFYGYDREKLRSMRIDEINLLPAGQVAAERTRALRESQNSFVFPHRLASGEERIVEVHSSPIQVGQAILLFSIIHDITERKVAEESLKVKEAAIASSINGIAIADPSGRLTYVNDAFVRMWGYETAEEIVATDRFKYWQDPAAVAPVVEAVTTRGQWVGELLARRRDGSTFHAQVVTSRVDDTNGHPLCILASFLDVSEKRLKEEEILQLNSELELRVGERTSQLEAANQEMEAFSYSVSHDLRAPLRAIEGFSGMLVKDSSEHLTSEDQRRIEVVRTNARKMSALIDDLLTFSRTGRHEIRHGRVLMQLLARSAYEEVVGAPEARAKVDFKLGPLPDADGDETLIRQVWVNLMSNAVKFSARQERPVIEVNGTSEGNLAVYHVRDNGAGFDPRYADKLFRVFQRLHGVTEFEGTGIGLALVKRIVERHGGRVWADGVVGEGATFSFSLPVRGFSERSSSWKAPEETERPR